MPTTAPLTAADLPAVVDDALAHQAVTDMHTHVFAPAFGASPAESALMLWGIDELVTYHYLIAEVFRVVPTDAMSYEAFWVMPRAAQADHIWQHLFVDRTPMSEACRGVISTLTALGLDPNEKTLDPYRRWFAQQDADAHVDRVMQLANVDCITMTNEVFSRHERALWLNDASAMRRDGRFQPVLRVDDLLVDWSAARSVLAELGYAVGETLDAGTTQEAQRFLRDWIARMQPAYLAVSLPPTFRYPGDTAKAGDAHTTDAMLDRVVLPVLAETNLPFAMMIGVTRHVNPPLRSAGDAVAKADVTAVANLCVRYPRQKFLVTMLSRENQHELCVAARKFCNLMIFGCWWFLNNPSLIDEITRMRLELLGPTFVPQHSDARILEQLIYKWQHSRDILANVLVDKYRDLIGAGYRVTRDHITRDAGLLLRDNYRRFIAP